MPMINTFEMKNINLNPNVEIASRFSRYDHTIEFLTSALTRGV